MTAPTARRGANASGKKPVVALVDDDRNILTSVSMMLEAEGFTRPDLCRWRVRVARPVRASARSCGARHQDAAHGRNGTAEPAASAKRSAGHISYFQGRRGGRDSRVTHGGGRLRQEAVLATPPDRADPHGVASAPPVRRRRGSVGPSHRAGGELQLDLDRYTCRWKESPVGLTVTEFLLLKELVERPGHVKSRNQLMDAAYGEAVYMDDRTIDSHIKRLCARNFVRWTATFARSKPFTVSDTATASPERPAMTGFSPLTRRILTVNMLPLAVLVAGILYLDDYREGLVEAELTGLEIQAEISRERSAKVRSAPASTERISSCLPLPVPCCVA